MILVARCPSSFLYETLIDLSPDSSQASEIVDLYNEILDSNE